jgi:hypothetical protein
MLGDYELLLKNTHFYKSFSIAITVRASETLNINLDDEAKALGCRLIPAITLDNSKIDNWSYGDEFYLVAIGFSAQITAYKTELEGNINSITQGKYTLLKTDSNGSMVNLMHFFQSEGMNSQYELSYIENGLKVSTIRKANPVNGTPADPRANNPQHTILWPVGEYSDTAAFGALMTRFEAELQAYGAFCMGQLSFGNYEILETIYSREVLESKVLAPYLQDMDWQTSTIYQYAFEKAKRIAERILVEVTLPTMDPKEDGIDMILIEALPLE